MISKVNILIVDDREDGLIALESVFAKSSYHLVKASSGEEAIRLAPTEDFAVILLDVQMPGMDGFETAAILKKSELTRHIPIIFVTAINKDDAYVYKGYEFGAVDYVFKPFDPQILRAKVDVFVDLYIKNQQIQTQNEKLREGERRERYLRLSELEIESLKRYRNLADSVPHAIWRAKPDGIMDYFNRVWTETTGLSEEQSLGGGWQSAFEPDDLKHLLRTWIEAMDTKQGFELECRLLAQGKWRWHWLKVVAELRMNGDLTAWLGTCTDIHERKTMEQNLILAREEAEGANHTKTQFLANMSHEIRTPLNSILGFSELMSYDTSSQAERSEYLHTIKRNGKNLLKIIDEILDISKVEANRLEIEMGEVDLRLMFAELQAALEHQSQEKGLTFTINCLTPIPGKVSSDANRLMQVFMNIIGNAIKFTDKGGVVLAISWLEEGAGSGKLICQVTDSGVGVDEKQRERLFQPFMQADSSISRKFGGTGLGLALSRRIANALGGDVCLEESGLGKGSTFTISIRGTVVPGVKYFSYSNHEMGAEAPTEKFQSKALDGLDVLVIDDANDNRQLISIFLSAAGARVDCAEDGIEGVSRALKKAYDVVLMDIQMPRLGGYEATTQLRDQGYSRPIIALTACAMKGERERSLSAGCDDHLTKPIDPQLLVDQVARLAGRITIADGVIR